MKNAVKKAGGKLAGSEKVRFGLVGLVNTAVDFGVLNLLVLLLGAPLVLANITSTTVAMFVSFALNKKAVFRGADSGGWRQIVLFFAVTLTGLWLVQTVAMVNIYNVLVAGDGMYAGPALVVAKLIGICFGLVWNYLWYSRVVFKSRSKQ